MKTSNAIKKLRGCGVYIFDESGERVLLAQRGPAARHEQYKWEGPGGKVDDDESYEQAAVREIHEEIGVGVELTGVIYETDDIVDSNGDHWEARVYEGRIQDTPSLPEPTKICGVAWFTKSEVLVLHEGGLLADYAVKDFEHIGWL